MEAIEKVKLLCQPKPKVDKLGSIQRKIISQVNAHFEEKLTDERWVNLLKSAVAGRQAKGEPYYYEVHIHLPPEEMDIFLKDEIRGGGYNSIREQDLGFPWSLGKYYEEGGFLCLYINLTGCEQ